MSYEILLVMFTLILVASILNGTSSHCDLLSDLESGLPEQADFPGDVGIGSDATTSGEALEIPLPKTLCWSRG